MGDDEALTALPDSLKKYLNTKSASALLNQVNSQQGVAPLAAAFVYAAGKTFMAGDQEKISATCILSETGTQ